MPKKVLCVDDDPAITELLSMLLQTQGFEVYTANSGEDGIKKVREKSLHIVVLDLMMPGVDGWQVCKEVREFSNVPIIILSALNDPEMIARALDAGADFEIAQAHIFDVRTSGFGAGERSAQEQVAIALGPRTCGDSEHFHLAASKFQLPV